MDARPSPHRPHSIPRNSARPRARNGRRPPKPGTAGGRSSAAGWAPPPRRCSTWPRRAGRARARRGRRRRRADARRRAARRAAAATCWPPTSRPRSCGYAARAPRARPGSPTSRRASSTASATTACGREPFDAAISRVGLIYFPDQQRALAGIRRRAASPAGASPRWCIRRRTRTRSSRCRSASSAAAPSCRRRCRASPGPSRSAATGVLAGDARAGGFPRRRGARGRLAGAAARRRPSACASSASRSARCTR